MNDVVIAEGVGKTYRLGEVANCDVQFALSKLGNTSSIARLSVVG